MLMGSKVCVLYCFLGDFVHSFSKDKELRAKMSEKYITKVHSLSSQLASSWHVEARELLNLAQSVCSVVFLGEFALCALILRRQKICAETA